MGSHSSKQSYLEPHSSTYAGQNYNDGSDYKYDQYAQEQHKREQHMRKQQKKRSKINGIVAATAGAS
jgi:hypothetical protein